MSEPPPLKRRRLDRGSNLKHCTCIECEKAEFQLGGEWVKGLMIDRRVWAEHNSVASSSTGSGSLLRSAHRASAPLHNLYFEQGNSGDRSDSVHQTIQNARSLALTARLSFIAHTSPSLSREDTFLYSLERDQLADDQASFQLAHSPSNQPFVEAENLLRAIKAQVFTENVNDANRDAWNAAVQALGQHIKKEWKRQHLLEGEISSPSNKQVEQTGMQVVLAAFFRLLTQFQYGE